MRDRYPGYDVLSKRNTPSWNETTRGVIDRRLAIDPGHHVFFNDTQWETLCALADRIVPQGDRTRKIPVAAMLDQKMHTDRRDGYRDARFPPMGEAWRRALDAIDAEARDRFGTRFHALAPQQQDALIRALQNGELKHESWQGMPTDAFFQQRLVIDMVKTYYCHPLAWNEIGFGGPASPRGYVRMDFDRRDSWEAAEAKPGHEDDAYRENLRVGR